MSNETVIQVENLVKTYRLGKVSIPALRGISFDVAKGEFLVVVGPSGSGKTTLLNLIGAIDKPTSGRISIDGRDVTTLGEGELTKLRRHKIGFIFQFYNLIPALKALENVELPMLTAGVSRKDASKRASQLLETVGLAERVEHLPDELSGGEQQRVAIARALANKPSLILADEPTGDLDTKTGTEVVQILYDTSKKENATVLVVTHDPMITEKADRILQLRDGNIIGEKKLKELI
ncbi:MAG: ABC transporter ATP-binding protein [Candidatus Bathyarchaeota archaeon]|nr:ABC transporter ATP-binding protein [Candidatus Bathyarchaeota archaeon]